MQIAYSPHPRESGLLRGSCSRPYSRSLTPGKAHKSTTAWWEGACRKGLWGSAGSCHHAPWAKHTGNGREEHNLTCVTGRSRSGRSYCSREVTGFFFFSSPEVKQEMEQRGDPGRTRREKQTSWLLGSMESKRTTSGWRVSVCWATLLGSRRGDVFSSHQPQEGLSSAYGAFTTCVLGKGCSLSSS